MRQWSSMGNIYQNESTWIDCLHEATSRILSRRLHFQRHYAENMSRNKVAQSWNDALPCATMRYHALPCATTPYHILPHPESLEKTHPYYSKLSKIEHVTSVHHVVMNFRPIPIPLQTSKSQSKKSSWIHRKPRSREPILQRVPRVGGWPNWALWKRLEFVNWDDEIPNIYIYIYVL